MRLSMLRARLQKFGFWFDFQLLGQFIGSIGCGLIERAGQQADQAMRRLAAN